MTYLKWQESFSVNVKEIDEQHRTLVGMVNTLHDAMVANRGRDAHKTIICDMVGYASVHFETEERYMLSSRYPEYLSHKAEHDRFTAKALELKDRADHEAFILTLEIMTFLKEWLQGHILGTDMRYSAHFNRHGVC